MVYRTDGDHLTLLAYNIIYSMLYFCDKTNNIHVITIGLRLVKSASMKIIKAIIGRFGVTLVK